MANFASQVGAYSKRKKAVVFGSPLFVFYTGSKTILFASDAITVSVNYPGAFIEVLPLLKGEMDRIKNGAVLTRGDVSLHIETEHALTFSETDLKSGDHQVVTAYINAENTLTYRIAFR